MFFFYICSVVFDDVGMDGFNRQRVNLWQGKNNVTFSWWGHRRSTRWKKAVRVSEGLLHSIPMMPLKNPSYRSFLFPWNRLLPSHSSLDSAMALNSKATRKFPFPSGLSKEIPLTPLSFDSPKSFSINVFRWIIPLTYYHLEDLGDSLQLA